MRNLNIAIRSLFKKGRHNVMKIISLSVGLSVALVMIAKIYFEQSYDTFYPDADRIYRIYENYSMNGKEEDYYQVSGAVAPAMRSEIPGVEDATRLTYIGGDNTLFTTPDKQRYSARYIMMADSNVFDIFPVPILSGNPKVVLAKPWYAMISRSLAEKMGGIEKVEGLTIIPDENPGLEVTIGGVFEDLPQNASLRYDMLVACLGETCALALLFGGVYLVVRRVISPVVPLTFIGTVAVGAGLASLTDRLPIAWTSLDFILSHVLSGGLLLGAIFMATDYATTPATRWGKVIFGFGCGLITIVIRLFGSYTEGVSFAILLMNILTPYIEKATAPKALGAAKTKKGGGKA